MAQSVAGGGDGVFYREYWGERRNTDGRFLRVNDAELSLHPTFGRRREARSNGLLLVEAPEDLFQVEAAELYLELWGGHPGTAAKRFMLNGRGPYVLPEVGTEAGHCTYSYPTVPLSVSHLVRGVNAFQFACDRGETFWGHYIVDNACLRVYLKPTHPDLEAAGMKAFSARVWTSTPATAASTTMAAVKRAAGTGSPFTGSRSTTSAPQRPRPSSLPGTRA